MNNRTPQRQLRVGVFGGAFITGGSEAEFLAMRIGRGIARRNHITVTGATSGLPHIAGKAALDAGGVVLGISPAQNIEEHVGKYGKPLDGCTHIFFTGQGYTGRNYLNLRNCDVAIFIGGEAGTLEEFCIGVYEKLVLGVLTSSGGICEMLPEIVTRFHTDHGGAFCFDEDPEELLDEVLAAYANLPKEKRIVGG